MKTLITVLASGFIVTQAFATGTPSVQFTSVPVLGANGLAVCTVQNVDRLKYGIAFFLDAFGVWYTKPDYNWPVTLIAADNTAAFVLGNWNGADPYAEKLAAFVVPLAYSNNIPVIGGVSPLPAEIYSNSIAYTILDRGSTNDYIKFSGMNWKKK